MKIKVGMYVKVKNIPVDTRASSNGITDIFTSEMKKQFCTSKIYQITDVKPPIKGNPEWFSLSDNIYYRFHHSWVTFINQSWCY